MSPVAPANTSRIAQPLRDWTICIVVVALAFTASPAFGAGHALTPFVQDDATGEEADDGCQDDCRPNFVSTFFIGSAIDNFAANDLRKYLNPDASGDPGVFERAIGGVQFAYRLFGSPEKKYQQLWVYGLTIHGVRSSDVDCTADPDIKVCKGFEDETDPSGRFLYIVRNASSLEANVGFRWEFLPLRSGTESPSSLFVSSQAGFLTVAGTGEDVIDMHHAGVGVTTTDGKFRDSYLELGYGRSDLFVVNPDRRWKINALMSWQPLERRPEVSAFARILVDADFGDGADSIQSYFGLRFDLRCLFAPGADCK